MVSWDEKNTFCNTRKAFEGRGGGRTHRVRRKVVDTKSDDNTKKLSNLNKKLKVAHRKISSIQTTTADYEVKEEEPLAPSPMACAQPSAAGTAFFVVYIVEVEEDNLLTSSIDGCCGSVERSAWI